MMVDSLTYDHVLVLYKFEISVCQSRILGQCFKVPVEILCCLTTHFSHTLATDTYGMKVTNV